MTASRSDAEAVFSAICRINLKKGKSCQINSWQVWAQRKITIISWHDTISMPVLPISDAVHCNRPRSALQPPLQCTASALASTCVRPCKYVFFYRVCISPKPYLDSLWPIWYVSSVVQIHAQPISVGFDDSESIFEIQMVSYFFESEVKCQNRKRGKTSEDLFDLIQ